MVKEAEESAMKVKLLTLSIENIDTFLLVHMLNVEMQIYRTENSSPNPCGRRIAVVGSL